MLDKQWIIKNFSAAAKTYDAVTDLQYQCGIQLLKQLCAFNIQPSSILDVGCGTGRVTQELEKYASEKNITAVDIAPGMIDYAKQHCSHPMIEYFCLDVEKDAVPSSKSNYDLIFSNFALQWCLDIKILLEKLKNQLSSNGVFAFVVPGEKTLHELKAIWKNLDFYDHVNDFFSWQDWLQLFSHLNMQVIFSEKQMSVLYYADVKAITHVLRQAGVHNTQKNRAIGLTGKSQWKKLTEAYETYRIEQGLSVTYETYFFIAKQSL